MKCYVIYQERKFGYIAEDYYMSKQEAMEKVDEILMHLSRYDKKAMLELYVYEANVNKGYLERCKEGLEDESFSDFWVRDIKTFCSNGTWA